MLYDTLVQKKKNNKFSSLVSFGVFLQSQTDNQPLIGKQYQNKSLFLILIVNVSKTVIKFLFFVHIYQNEVQPNTQASIHTHNLWPVFLMLKVSLHISWHLKYNIFNIIEISNEI